MSAPARPLTGPEREAFRLGRLVAAERAPYFMHALFAVAPVAAPGLGTFAVDAAWRLYMDPSLLDGQDAWDATTIGGVLLHEVGHLLRDHAARATALPAPVHHLAWNLAGDAEINDDLLAAGIPLPEGVITPDALGCADGDLAENYYAALTPPGQPSLPDDGGAGCGSGSGCHPAPGELPAGVGLANGSASPFSPAEGDLVRRRVARDVLDAEQAKGRGHLPAGLTRWASDTLAPPTIAWERLLRAAVRRAVADHTGRTDYSYSRPSRRTLPRIIRPSMRAPLVKVAVVVDTSGSMGQADLQAALSELHGVLHAFGVARDSVRLVSCDAQATSAQRVRSATTVNLQGGGGTDMRVGITAAEQANPAPDVVIVLTDGDTPWPDAPTRARLICAIISHHNPTGTPGWATTVHITPAT